MVKRIFDSLGDRLSIFYESGERKKFRACASSGFEFHPPTRFPTRIGTRAVTTGFRKVTILVGKKLITNFSRDLLVSRGSATGRSIFSFFALLFF